MGRSGAAFGRTSSGCWPDLMKPCRRCGADDRFPSGGCRPCNAATAPERNRRAQLRRAGGLPMAERARCGQCGRRHRDGKDCPPKKPASVAKPCIQCGAAPRTSGAKTCSPACAQARQIAMRTPRLPGRSSKKACPSYQRKDKQAWIEYLLREQECRCAICGRDGRLVLDHDHALVAPRAMLCVPCNAALGLLGEDPARAESLARYAKACQDFRSGLFSMGAEAFNKLQTPADERSST